jgi:hypothetical protein
MPAVLREQQRAWEITGEDCDLWTVMDSKFSVVWRNSSSALQRDKPSRL